MREDPNAWETSSTTIKFRDDEITHLFGRLLLQPGASLLDKCLILAAVCTVADDRYDTILEIFL
jgi:hypothetical protein